MGDKNKMTKQKQKVQSYVGTSNEEWAEVARKYAKEHGLETTPEGKELRREFNYFLGLPHKDKYDLHCNYHIGRYSYGGWNCIHESADKLTVILSQGDFDKVESDLISLAELFDYKTTFQNTDEGVRRESHFNYVPGTVHLRLLDGFRSIPLGEGFSRTTIPEQDVLRLVETRKSLGDKEQTYFQARFTGNYNLAFLFTDEQDKYSTRDIPHHQGKKMIWKVATRPFNRPWEWGPLIVNDVAPSENAIAFAMKDIRNYLKGQRMPFCVLNAGIYWHPGWKAETSWFNT